MNNTSIRLEAEYVALRKALLLHRNRAKFPPVCLSQEMAEFIDNDMGYLTYSDGAILLDGCEVTIADDCNYWDVNRDW